MITSKYKHTDPIIIIKKLLVWNFVIWEAGLSMMHEAKKTSKAV